MSWFPENYNLKVFFLLLLLLACSLLFTQEKEKQNVFALAKYILWNCYV